MSTVTLNKNSTSIKIPARIEKTVFKRPLSIVKALKPVEKSSIYDQQRENIRKNEILRKELSKLKSGQKNKTLKIEKDDAKLKSNGEFDIELYSDFYSIPRLLSPIKDLKKKSKKLINPFAVPQQVKERLIDAELKNMIDNFAMNIEYLFNQARVNREIELKDDMISEEGKRKLIFKKNSNSKRQKV